jgi:hypothetical protein
MARVETVQRGATHVVLAVISLLCLFASACGSASTAVAPSSTEDKCTLSVTASVNTVEAAGGKGQLAIQAGRECAWSASSAVPWITFESATQGQGEGSVNFVVARNVDPAPRSGVMSVGDHQVSITQRAGSCEYRLTMSGANVPAAGGRREVEVSTSSQACPWTAASRVDWIRIQSGASGTGNGRVVFDVAAATGPPRTGSLTIADRTVSVTQADGCNYSVSSSRLTVPAAGGAAAVSVTTSGACPWTVTSGVSWITAQATAAIGSGTARLAIAANSGPERSETVTIAGQDVVVEQASGCSFQVNPRTLSAPTSGGVLSVSVITSPACPWTANSAVPWITVTGAESGSVRLTVAGNAGPDRSGAVTVAGQAVTVQQSSGCSYVVSPKSLLFGANGNTFTIAIATVAGCPWTASTNEPSWLILSTAGGTGPGTLDVRARSNSGPERSGTIFVAGQTVTAVQRRYCRFDLSPSSASFGPTGGSGSFRVRTDGGCEWRAGTLAGVDWVRITRGASGNGDGTVEFVVAPNPGGSRTTAIMVEDQPFRITQGGV